MYLCNQSRSISVKLSGLGIAGISSSVVESLVTKLRDLDWRFLGPMLKNNLLFSRITIDHSKIKHSFISPRNLAFRFNLLRRGASDFMYKYTQETLET